MASRFRPWHLIAAAGLGGLLAWLVLSPAPVAGPRPHAGWRDALPLRRDGPFPRAMASGDPDVAPFRLPERPERIVAASVLSAEVVLAIAPRGRIAGVHYLAADVRYSTVAKDVAGLPQVGAEPEQLLAVRPDLVLIDEFTKAETQALLAAAGVPVVRTHGFHDVADVADNIRLLGWVTGCDVAAEQLVEQMNNKIVSLAQDAKSVRGWRVLSLDGGLGTYGQGSLLDTVLHAAGADNLAADHRVGPFRKLDVESVLAWRPDALLVGVVPGEEGTTRARLRQDPALRLLSCVQKDHIVFVPNAVLGSTSHHLAEAAAEVQAQLRKWGRP